MRASSSGGQVGAAPGCRGRAPRACRRSSEGPSSGRSSAVGHGAPSKASQLAGHALRGSYEDPVALLRCRATAASRRLISDDDHRYRGARAAAGARTADRRTGTPGYHDLRRDVRAGRARPAPSISDRASPTPTVPRAVLEAARQAIASGANQYPPGRGIPELRQAIAAHQRALLRAGLRPGHGGAGHGRRDRGARRLDPRASSTRATRSSLSSRSTTPTAPSSRSRAACTARVPLRGAGLPPRPRRARARRSPTAPG